MARRRKGLGQLLKKGTVANQIVPPAIGGILAAGTMIAVRAWVKPTSAAGAKAYQWAPGIGALAGATIGGLASYFLGGSGAAGSAAVAALLVGGSPLVAERLLAADVASGAIASNGASGMGMVTAEYAGPGTGAIVWEQLRGLRGLGANQQGQGEVVALSGTVDNSAFGTRPFGG